jgi:hypothetical protein
MGDGRNAQLATELAFAGQPTGQPIDLAGNVAIDVGVAQGFEPPRGSRAQVSINVLAVHNDGALFVRTEPLAGRGRAKLRKGQTDGAWQVFVFVLFGRQDLDNRGTLVAQLLHSVTIDISRHSARSGRTAHARLYTPGVMVSMSGGGGGAALSSPAGILVLLVVIAIVGGVFWLFNR